MTMTQTTPLRTALEFDLADRLRKTLRLSGYSVADMAAFLHVDRNTVGSWINGRNTPRISTLMVWAEKTETPFDWLRTGEITCRWLQEEQRWASHDEEWAFRESERAESVRPKGLEPLTFCSVAGERAFWGLAA